MERKRSHFFLTGHIQCKQSLSPRSLELRGNFKCTDDHIFEKTLKIDYLPYPRHTPLNGNTYTCSQTCLCSHLYQTVTCIKRNRRQGENNRPVTSHWQTLSQKVAYLALIEIRTHNISRDRSKYNDISWLLHHLENCRFKLIHCLLKWVCLQDSVASACGCMHS